MPESDILEPISQETTAEPQEPVETDLETQEPSEPAEPTEPSEGEEEPAGEPAEAEETPSGAEPLPKDVQKFLREARQTPENAPIARQLQDSWYANRAYKEQFPTVEDAKVAKATLDALGGADGIIEMRQNAEMLDEIDSSIERGDPRVIEDAIESYPEGAAKLIEHGLNLLERNNPDGYAQMLRGPFIKSLLGTGIADRVGYAMEALEAGQTDFAARQINAVYQYLQGLAGEAQRPRQAQQLPQAAQQPQAQGQDREIDLNRRELMMGVGPYLQNSITSEVTKLNGNKPPNSEALNRLMPLIGDEIDRALGADRVYQTNMDSYLRRGQIQEAMKYAQVHIDKVRGQASRDVWTQIYGSTRQVQRPARPAQSNGNGTPQPARQQVTGKGTPEAPVQVARRPESRYIDYEKTDPLFIMAGKAYLTDGRFVQWKRK